MLEERSDLQGHTEFSPPLPMRVIADLSVLIFMILRSIISTNLDMWKL